MRKSVIVLVLFSVFVSCGRQEFLTEFGNDLKKGKDNILEASKKAAKDTVNTSIKAFNDFTREAAKDTASFITEANDLKNQQLKSSGDFTEMVGSQAESIGQVPRNIGNEILGTDSHSKEDINDLENELDALRVEMYQQLSEVNSDIYDVKFDLKQSIDGVNAEIRQSNTDLQNAIDSVQTELLDEINQVKRLSKRLHKKAIRKINNKIRRVKQAIRRVKRNVNNLEVVCQYDRVYIIFSGFVQFAEYCELSNSRNR